MAYKFELTKARVLRHAELKEKLAAALETLQAAEQTANEKIIEIVTVINQEIVTFNEVLTQARMFAEQIHQEAQKQIEAKSTRWQEGAAGGTAAEWQTAWENIDLSSIDLIGELTIDIDKISLVEFEQLPVSSG